MCNTYTIHHICGHIHTLKTIKCSAAINHQLVLVLAQSSNTTKQHRRTQSDALPRSQMPSAAQSPESAMALSRSRSLILSTSTSAAPNQRDVQNNEKTCQIEDIKPHITLIPNACTSCTELGIVSDWLNRDPGLRLQIVREWKRRGRVGGRAGGAAAAASSGVEMPVSDGVVLKEGEIGLEVMSPVLIGFWDGVGLDREGEGIDIDVGAQEKSGTDIQQDTFGFSARAARIKERLEMLLADQEKRGRGSKETC